MAKDIPLEELYSQPIVQQLLQKLEQKEIDINDIKLPYVMKDKVLMSPGVWNDYFYSANSIKQAFLKSEWDTKEVRSLFLDHVDNSSREWIGEVKNQRMDGDSVIGDLVIIDMPTAQKLAYGAKMGISPKVFGMEEEQEMIDFSFSNFSVVINPAVKTAYINNMQKENAATEPYGKVKYADPGYKGDKKRYPIDTEAHVRAAWSYINVPKNQEGYTADQLKNIKSKIKAAAKKYGISIKNVEVNKMTEEEKPKEPAAKENEEAPKEDAPKEEAPKEEAPAEEKKEEEAAAPKEDAPKEDAPKEEAPAEAENSEDFKAMSELDVVKKAKEMQKKDEPFKDALMRATKEMEEKESEMAEADVINQILKLAEILKNKVAPETLAEAPKAPEESTKIAEMKETINTLSEKLESVEKKLNEPAPKTAMKTEELSATDAENIVAANPDEALLQVFKGMGGM